MPASVGHILFVHIILTHTLLLLHIHTVRCRDNYECNCPVEAVKMAVPGSTLLCK